MCTASNDHDWVNVLDARSLPIFLPASIDTTNRSAECMQVFRNDHRGDLQRRTRHTWLHPRCFEKAKDKDLKKCALAEGQVARQRSPGTPRPNASVKKLRLRR
jgi:hypothetical protein